MWLLPAILHFLLLLRYSVQGEKLLVVLVEGFAGSAYPMYSGHPGFAAFEKEGVWSDLLQPVFPSLSLPNQYTIATGKYPVDHGIVGNFMFSSFDNDEEDYFMGAMRPEDFQAKWWDKAEPIWLTASKANISTAVYYWIGSQVKFPGAPNYYSFPFMKRSNGATLSMQNVDTIMEETKKHDLVMVYHDGISKETERHGPQRLYQNESRSVRKFADILEQIVIETKKREDLNVIVLSDRGVLLVPPENRRHLENYVNMNLIKMTVGIGAIKQIIPTPGESTHKIYTELRDNPIPNVALHYTTPEMSALPAEYKYTSSNRIPVLLLIAQPGYGIYTTHRSKQTPVPSFMDYTLGVSGYENTHSKMLGIFLGYGPRFKKGYRKGFANILDIHPLMCDILKLECPAGNGSLDGIDDVFKPSSPPLSAQSSNARSNFSCFLLLCLMLLYASL